MFGFEPRFEYLFSVNVQLRPAEVIGPVPEGIRANFYFTGGSFEGPKVRGTIRPVGGDWFTMRPDGVGCLDIRATAETADGALIYAAYTGLTDAGEDGYEHFARGELPPTFPLRVTPRFSTAHPAYRWLNRLQCVGIGEVDTQKLEIRYDIYALK